jgi:hypothetical protein
MMSANLKEILAAQMATFGFWNALQMDCLLFMNQTNRRGGEQVPNPSARIRPKRRLGTGSNSREGGNSSAP